MDVKLESLIEKIKKDGIQEGQKASADIIQKAQNQAECIVKDAKVQARELIEKAKNESQRLQDNAAKALKQGARDLILVLKGQIIGILDKILKEKISKELNPNLIKELIVKLVNKWQVQGEGTLEVFVTQKDKNELKGLLISSFKEKAAASIIEVKVSKALDKGFRVGLKGEDAHYDFTDESILEALKEFLNPAVCAILNGAVA